MYYGHKMQVQIVGYLVRGLREMKINFNRIFSANLFNFPVPLFGFVRIQILKLTIVILRSCLSQFSLQNFLRSLACVICPCLNKLIFFSFLFFKSCSNIRFIDRTYFNFFHRKMGSIITPQ